MIDPILVAATAWAVFCHFVSGLQGRRGALL